MRLVVQVCGILLTACLTLFCAAPLTLLVMAWVGRRQQKQGIWKWALLFSVVIAMVFLLDVQPGLQKEVRSQERAKRGRVIDALIRAKLEEYRAGLKERQEQLLCQEDWYSRENCFFDITVVSSRGPNKTLLVIRVSCSPGEVIHVVSHGGTKEDDFLTALTDLIREHGWKMKLTRERAAEDEAKSKAPLQRRTP